MTELLLAHREGVPGASTDLWSWSTRSFAAWRTGNFGAVVPMDKCSTPRGLVHEAYLKLVDQTRIGATDRNHFLAIAARAMRQVIVDHARGRTAAKRGAGPRHVPLDDRDLTIQQQAEHLLAVNDALERLAKEHPRLLQVVECRFFAGYSEAEEQRPWRCRLAPSNATGCAPRHGCARQ